MGANATPTAFADMAIPLGTVSLQGTVGQPAHARGVVVFAHGSGSSRHSPRNRHVASLLQDAGFATLLFDLLTEEEEEYERHTRHLRFDIGLLAQRLLGATHWLDAQSDLTRGPIGYFGSSTGAAAALVAAAEAEALAALAPGAPRIAAVVSRGGRPDLAGAALAQVRAPTLLIVGDRDTEVIALNRDALAQLRCRKALELVPGATHLFEEPGTLDAAARLAVTWFDRYLVTEAA